MGNQLPDHGQFALAVVCGSPVVRSGLECVLEDVPGLIIRYSVDSVAALKRHSVPPDQVVIDLYALPGARIGATFWAGLPGRCGVVALCPPEDPPDLIVALQGGVRALLTRDSDVDELRLAVRTARSGGVHLSRELARQLIVQHGTANPQHLAPREIETLRWVAEGLTHGQIGRRMGLSESTVSAYVKRIRAKLHAGNKADLTRMAIKLGYVVRH